MCTGAVSAFMFTDSLSRRRVVHGVPIVGYGSYSVSNAYCTRSPHCSQPPALTSRPAHRKLAAMACVHVFSHAPLAQRIEQLPSKQLAAGSNPAGGATSQPLVYAAAPLQVLEWVRAHWRIENRSHLRSDSTLEEDRLQLSNKSAALVMATLNCIILALFDHLRIANSRKAMRNYNVHPENALDLLFKPL